MSWQYSKSAQSSAQSASNSDICPTADVCAILRSRIAPTNFSGMRRSQAWICSIPAKLVVLVGRQRLINIPIGRYFVERGYLNEAELAACLDALHMHNIRVRANSRIPGQ